MFHKDTFRLIRKTRKRFVTIMLIVLIGVGFMVGLMCSAPTMRLSVDKYFDDYNFMDVQLYSSYGFDDRDVNALHKAQNVEDIFATKFVDVFVENDESKIITRVQEIDSSVNNFELIDGRMPQNSKEALALGASESSFGSVFSIGDKVKVYLEDDDLSESLNTLEYEIVGIVRTPQYMASSKETSTLNNLSLTTAIYVDNDNFINDYYTSVYLTFKDSKKYHSFKDEYYDFIEKNLDELEDVIDKQETVRRDEVIAEITEKIENGEIELNDEISKAQAEIDDGKKQLEDAYIQILVGEAQIASSKEQLAEGEKEIAVNEQLLADGEKQIRDGKKQLEDQTGMSFNEAASFTKTAYSVYNIVNRVIENTNTDTDSTIAESIDKKTAEISKLSAENTTLTASNTELQVQNTALNIENETLKLENQTLEAENKLLGTDAEANAQKIAENSTKILENTAKVAENESTVAANNKTVAENEAKIDSNNDKISTLAAEIAELEGIQNIVGNEILHKVPEMINEMFGGDIKTAYKGVLQMEAAIDEIADGKKQLEAAKLELENGKVLLAESEKQLLTGRKEYENNLKKLEDAQETLDEEYEKARIELDKAKQQLSELPDAQWTVLDRDSHYSTAMFKNNADQMQRIGDVFPLLFCLVAALVCMTTMKRLVDEERSQIGVFSALGFSKGKIISKYAIYALSASLIGSGVGIPIGIFSLPWVIYVCWRMMYDLPDMALCVPGSIAVLGVCLFTFLMLWVTFTVVRNVLKECPSQLMRPKAPRNAKKVFLEKIPFIWKRLSFTSKVTARNIIRYKSRFFMTVVGVAGCTSLLVLGFAIKGSISQVISRQYQDIISYDTTITLESADYSDEICDQLLSDSKVENAVPYMTYSSMAYTKKEDKAIQAYIMDEDSVHDIFNMKERRNQKPISLEDGVVISEKFANLCGISVGDEITIESSNGIKQSVEVTAICEMYTQHFMFMSDEFYADTFNETVKYKNIAVVTEHSDAIVNKYEDYEGVETIADFTEIIATFSSMLDTLDIIVIVVIIAAGSLALVVITNLTEVNISERIREIATLKVLGFNNNEVYSYIFKEVFLLSLLGMLIGLPLAKLELIFVMQIIEMEMVMFSTIIEPLSYIYGLVIILLFTIFVILLMRKTLRNVQMVESLKSVE